MTAPRRFAIVGCGAIADTHVEALKRHPAIELVAGVDPAEGAQKKVREQWGCEAYPDLDAAFANGGADAVVICTPPTLHRVIAQKAFDHGAHVLCEKPIATTADDATAMRNAASRAGRVLMVSSKFRYVDDLVEAKRMIDEGAIGEPVYYEVTFCAHVPMNGRWNTQPDLSGGGVVMDNAAHAFDVLSNVLDSPIVEIGAAFSRPVQAESVEDTAEIQFRTAKGTLGRVALSWTYFTKDLDYVMVQGTEGGIRVAWTGGLHRPRGERDWKPFGGGYNKHAAFDKQLETFLVWAETGATPSQAGDPAHTVALINAAYGAQSDGRWRSVQ